MEQNSRPNISNAMFILDWSWGKIYAVHLTPDGSTYTGQNETFITGSPLPVTDAITHPEDGTMYFAIGGRKVQSGLYRVSYVGKEKTDPASMKPQVNELAKLRHQLEDLHIGEHPDALDIAWPHIDHPDRFIRWASHSWPFNDCPWKNGLKTALTEKNSGQACLCSALSCQGYRDRSFSPQKIRPADQPGNGQQDPAIPA
jgi:hypothetical protein